LCGFLNHRGGHVLIGVTNNQRILGQDVSDQTRQDIASLLKKIEPTPVIDVGYVSIKDSSCQVIVLTAHHDEFAIPYTFEGRAYDRSQSTTSIMPRDRYHRLLLEKTQGNRGWEDGTINDITLDDLDHDEIIRTIQVGVSSGRIPPTKSTNGVNLRIYS
jgi:ATP-dependent DNA helicase RecG